MRRSLSRTLAIRFAGTMLVGLAGVSGAAYWEATRVIYALPAPAAAVPGVERDMLIALVGLVLLGGAATLVGAWTLVESAMRPVGEITTQATHIEAGTLEQRILAHADTDEYRDLVAVLNRMLERLERGFAAQRRLTADVSHELRTPLTALRGELEVALRSERTAGEYQRVLRSALEESLRLSEMAEDLLLITRAESHQVRPVLAPHDVNALIEDQLHPLRRRIAEKGLRVVSAYGAALPPVSVDDGLASRLIGYLLDNAVKFAPPESTVTVTTRANGAVVHLLVEDQGPGIAAHDLPHVFEPFYRADQARTRGEGTGLGLALAAAVARLHGGTISAGNAAGGGASFDVAFPSQSSSGAAGPC